MAEQIKQILYQFVRERFTNSRIHEALQNPQSSHLFELIGKPGSGKSYVIQPLLECLEGTYTKIIRYSPHPMLDNHLKDFLTTITNVSNSDLEAMLAEHQAAYNNGKKYDFFYFLSNRFSQRNLFQPCLIIIDDCDILDVYTRDFLQYLVHYAEDTGIQIITLSHVKLFPFSEIEFMQPLSVEDVQVIIQKGFPDSGIGYAKESEILHNISEGNLLIISSILSDMVVRNKKRSFDLSYYIDKRFNTHELFLESINSLTDNRQKLLIKLLLMDGRAALDAIKAVHNLKGLSQDLTYLIDKDLIYIYNEMYFVHKKSALTDWFNQTDSPSKEDSITHVLEYFSQAGCCVQLRAKFSNLLKLDKIELYKEAVEEFSTVCDNEAGLQYYNLLLSVEQEPAELLNITKHMGICYSNMNLKDKASEYFRQCLQICSTHDLPAEEIIHLLATNLFAINSSNFALEIIRKYSPTTISPLWKTKILVLKSEILTETEQFDEANEVIDEVTRNLPQIEDKPKRYSLQAEAKKIKGKIHYYVNEWDAAEEAFKEAETLYNLANDQTGLAAIYNNLGVLHMFQGEWDISKQFFIRSLNLEREHFNLNGISVCFNNLGGLMDDKGDQNRSLYYLEEALKIQKLLNEPYNITNIYNNIGVTWMDNNYYDEAEKALRKSLETAKEFGFYRNTVASLNNLGALFFKMGDWNQAIDFYMQAVSKSEENNFSEGLLRSYNNLGELYEKQDEFNLAYDLYFKGLELLPQLSDEYIKAELYGNIGSVLAKLHRFKEAYSYLVESFDFFKGINARDKIVEGCQKQAYYFILTRNYESADYYLTQAVKLASELNHPFELGRAYYLRALLERKNVEQAQQHLNEAIRLFIETSNNYELSLANYELASILYEQKEWEQALQILKSNKKIIQQFGSIKILEQNDILVQKITREYSAELKDAKFEENLLNQFYEITQKLNTITDLDVLIEQSLQSLVDIAEADGGILCLHNNPAIPESWDYKVYHQFSHDDKYYDVFMDLCRQAWSDNHLLNFKQPHFAPDYNNIVVIPLTMRKKAQGVVLLFCRHGSHYFSERIVNLLSALSNQIIVIIENIQAISLEKSHAILREQLNPENIYANIIGTSPEMLKIYDIIEKIKDTPTSVLLEGPSGTGKELIARALHYSSNRRAKAFVAQYCGALPETLLESELFGHVKGSFTGAAYDKKGLFEIADGGTFFLDEIADISLSTQAKLLRFLQEGEIKRVGSTKTEKVNVRVVCATNVPLLEHVKKGVFRLDLYYRLNVIRIDVPPLKVRSGDVPLLAIHFLDKYNKRMNKTVPGISDEAMKCLECYEWPGNVRQLENEIERAVTLAEEGAFIKPSDLSDEVYKSVEYSQTINLLRKRQTLKDAIEQLEQKMIKEVMEENAWNQTQAAKELGLSRQGLIKKLRRYNLYRESEE